MMKYLRLTGIWISILGLISCNRPLASANDAAKQKKTADSVSFFTSDQMDKFLQNGLDSVIRSNGSPLLATHILGSSMEGAPYLLVIRSGPGMVEVHEQWDDVVIIRSGHGILKTGYQVVGDKKETSPGNWVGGSILGGNENVLSPGDFLIIPAMEGHQYIPGTGDHLTYWTIKVKRPIKL